MNRLLLVLLFAAGILVSLLEANAAEVRKPNIICILADDLGIPAIGCYGGAYKTPNIDALAAGGMRFEYCFAAPLCAPSRALLNTGRYAFRTGVTSNGLGAQATPQKDGSVALLMKQAGYATAVAGKWRQLSYFTTKEDGAKWGYDEFLIWGAGEPEEGESDECTAPDDENNKNDKSQQTNNSRKKATDKPDRYWDPDYNHNGKMVESTEGKYGPDMLNEFVIGFARRHRDGPFFVYYPTPLIHGPILPTPDSKETDKTKERKGNNAGEGSHYWENVAYLDKLIGQLVSELDALKIRDNTLIVFMGDNGSVPIGTINGRKIEGKKNTMLEGGSRVPLIANWPAVTPRGKVKSDLVDFSDMLPTFAELAGAKLSDTIKIDGHSFAPQLHGEPGLPREWAYVQLDENRYVRDQQWKLTGDGKLYDMKDAPFQQILVPDDSTDPQATAARAKLQPALDRLAAEAAATNDMPVKKRRNKKQ